MKTLFVFLHGIGDVVMFTGPLREYKKENPDEDIDVVVSNRPSAEILNGNKNIRNVFVSEVGRNPRFWNPFFYYFIDLWKIKNSLKKFKNYDKMKIIPIQTMPEIFYRVFGYRAKNKTERIAKEIGVRNLSNLSSEMFSSSKDVRRANEIVPKNDFVVVHPFSRDPKKAFDGDLLKKIKKAESYKIFLVGGTNEKNVFKRESGAYGEGLGVVREIIKKSKGFIGTDSAISHIAGTTDVPIKIISNRGKIKGISHAGNPEWFFPWGRKIDYLQY